jgi:hypothetical protein
MLYFIRVTMISGTLAVLKNNNYRQYRTQLQLRYYLS